MPRFRKRPVEVEAVQFDGTGRSYYDICTLAPGIHLETTPEGIRIPTLEGTMLAVHGDYVIRGIKGELYPCKPDIFATTYEPVEP